MGWRHAGAALLAAIICLVLSLALFWLVLLAVTPSPGPKKSTVMSGIGMKGVGTLGCVGIALIVVSVAMLVQIPAEWRKPSGEPILWQSSPKRT